MRAGSGPRRAQGPRPKRSEIFYSDILGMRVVSRISDPPMTFFKAATSDQHHDFALMELSPVHQQHHHPTKM